MILRDTEDAFDEMAQAQSEPTGTLRLTAPYDYGMTVIVPLVSVFTAKYPACRIELKLSDQTLDLVSGQIDMAIRIGWLTDSSLQARRIGSFKQLLVASKTLSKTLAKLKHPENLAALPFVANAALRNPLQWHFSRGALERCSVQMKSSIAIDTTQAVHQAVQAGGGLSVLPDYLVDRDLAAGRLIHALPKWELPSGGIHVVFPAARYRPAKVRVFMEMLIQAEKKRQK